MRYQLYNDLKELFQKNEEKTTNKCKFCPYKYTRPAKAKKNPLVLESHIEDIMGSRTKVGSKMALCQEKTIPTFIM